MENLPAYINIVFMAAVVFTALLLFKATNYSKSIIVMTLLWLILQSVIGLTGFYTVLNAAPPRFPLLLLPPVLVLIISFSIKKARYAMDGFNAATLTLIHTVRILVELTLYWLYLHKAVPGLITFEGRNFDVLCGITAPFIYYFGYVKKVIGRKVLIAWNIACLLLLANVVVTAVLSVPLPIQQFAFDQPNIAMLYFPFVLLPCFIVPVVLFAHFVCLRQLIKAK